MIYIKKNIEYLHSRIVARFPSKRTDSTTFGFVGFEYERLFDGRTRVHQSVFTQKLLEQHGFEQSHPVPTLLLRNYTPRDAKSEPGTGSTSEFDFASALGGAGHLTHTRPDLMFFYDALTTVGTPSLVCPNAPNLAHRHALTHGLLNINGSRNHGLIYDGAHGLELTEYNGASFAREAKTNAHGNAKSRSGFVVVLCAAMIAQASLRQVPVALSTPEAKVHPLMLCTRAVLCIRRLLSFALGVTLSHTVIFEDNSAVIGQLKKRDLAANTRHNRLNFNFIFKAIDERASTRFTIFPLTRPATPHSAAPHADT